MTRDCAVCVAIHRVPDDHDCGHHPPADDNLHLQLEPGEVVLDGEAEQWRMIAELNSIGQLRIHREHWSTPGSAYPDGSWRRDRSWGGQLSTEAARRLAAVLGAARDSDLTACEEQLDVYRSRCQQLAGRVAELEDLLAQAGQSVGAVDSKCGSMEVALRSLIARVRRTGGYATPEEQDVLREAERAVGGEG